MNPEQIIVGGGTAGLILFLAYAVRELWNDHKTRDKDTIDEKRQALDGWKAQTTATDKLVGVVEGLAQKVAGLEAQVDRLVDEDGRTPVRRR